MVASDLDLSPSPTTTISWGTPRSRPSAHPAATTGSWVTTTARRTPGPTESLMTRASRGAARADLDLVATWPSSTGTLITGHVRFARARASRISVTTLAGDRRSTSTTTLASAA